MNLLLHGLFIVSSVAMLWKLFRWEKRLRSASLPRSQDVYRPGRIYKEWTRLAPEYGETLHVCRHDYSEAHSFYDALQLMVNWKFWKGLSLQHDRHAYCKVAVPFAYELKYDYHGMGQHHYEFEFWLLNVVM